MAEAALIYTMHEAAQGVLLMRAGGGYDQSIVSTVSDAIVRS